MPSTLPTAISLGSIIRRRPVGAQLSAASGLGCPSRYAGGLRTVVFIRAIPDHALSFKHFIVPSSLQALEVTMRGDERAISIQCGVAKASASVKGSSVRGHTAA